jgi:hypothetical protein
MPRSAEAERGMSEVGYKQRSRTARGESGVPVTADIRDLSNFFGSGPICEILTASGCFPHCSQHRTLFGSAVHGRLRLPRGQSVTPLREKRCDRSVRLV